MKYKKQLSFLKTISATLIVAFVLSDISYAAPGGLSFLSAPLAAKIQIDPSIGRVEEISRFARNDKTPLIIHIQDAHTNSSAQKNISKILESLIQKHSIKNVYIEGGSKDDSLTFLRPLLSKESREQIGNKYLASGEMSGAEYLSFTSELNFSLLGVEDMALYHRNVKQYADLVAHRGEILDFISNIQNRTNSLKLKNYSSELLKLESIQKSAEEGSGSFSDYTDALLKAAKTSGVNLLAYPFISSLKDLKSAEEKVDFSNLSEDRSDLIAYLNLVKKFSSADVGKLTEELEALHVQIFEQSLSEEGLELYQIDRYLKLLKKLVTLQITQKEYREYADLSRRVEFQPVMVMASLNQKLYELGRYEDALKYTDLLERFEPLARGFYELSFKRDEAFVRNVIASEAKQSRKDKSPVVLITGGFHTAHLKELFKEKGFGYAVVTPFMTHETNVNRYEKLLLGSSNVTVRTGSDKAAILALLERSLPEVSARLNGEPVKGFFKDIAAARLASEERSTSAMSSLSGSAYPEARAVKETLTLKTADQILEGLLVTAAQIRPNGKKEAQIQHSVEFLKSVPKLTSVLSQELESVLAKGVLSNGRIVTAGEADRALQVVRGVFDTPALRRKYIRSDGELDRFYDQLANWFDLEKRAHFSQNAEPVEKLGFVLAGLQRPILSAYFSWDGVKAGARLPQTESTKDFIGSPLEAIAQLISTQMLAYGESHPGTTWIPAGVEDQKAFKENILSAVSQYLNQPETEWLVTELPTLVKKPEPGKDYFRNNPLKINLSSNASGKGYQVDVFAHYFKENGGQTAIHTHGDPAVVVTLNANFSERMYKGNLPADLKDEDKVHLEADANPTSFKEFAVSWVEPGNSYIHVISGKGIILEFYLKDFTREAIPAFRFEGSGPEYTAKGGMFIPRGARLSSAPVEQAFELHFNAQSPQMESDEMSFGLLEQIQISTAKLAQLSRIFGDGDRKIQRPSYFIALKSGRPVALVRSYKRDKEPGKDSGPPILIAQLGKLDIAGLTGQYGQFKKEMVLEYVRIPETDTFADSVWMSVASVLSASLYRALPSRAVDVTTSGRLKGISNFANKNGTASLTIEIYAARLARLMHISMSSHVSVNQQITQKIVLPISVSLRIELEQLLELSLTQKLTIAQKMLLRELLEILTGPESRLSEWEKERVREVANLAISDEPNPHQRALIKKWLLLLESVAKGKSKSAIMQMVMAMSADPSQPIFGQNKYIEAYDQAKTALAEQGAVGLIAGNMPTNLWGRNADVKPLDVIVLSETFDIAKAPSKLVHWWVPTRNDSQRLFQNQQGHFIQATIEIEPAVLNTVQPGIYLPPVGFAESVMEWSARALLHGSISEEDDGEAEKFDRLFQERVKKSVSSWRGFYQVFNPEILPSGAVRVKALNLEDHFLRDHFNGTEKNPMTAEDFRSQYKRDENPRNRARIVRAIAESLPGSNEAAGFLAEAIEDRDSNVRLAAIEELVKLKVKLPAALQALYWISIQEWKPIVREAALKALKYFEGARFSSILKFFALTFPLLTLLAACVSNPPQKQDDPGAFEPSDEELARVKSSDSSPEIVTATNETMQVAFELTERGLAPSKASTEIIPTRLQKGDRIKVKFDPRMKGLNGKLHLLAIAGLSAGTNVTIIQFDVNNSLSSSDWILGEDNWVQLPPVTGSIHSFVIEWEFKTVNPNDAETFQNIMNSGKSLTVTIEIDKTGGARLAGTRQEENRGEARGKAKENSSSLQSLGARLPIQTIYQSGFEAFKDKNTSLEQIGRAIAEIMQDYGDTNEQSLAHWVPQEAKAKARFSIRISEKLGKLLRDPQIQKDLAEILPTLIYKPGDKDYERNNPFSIELPSKDGRPGFVIDVFAHYFKEEGGKTKIHSHNDPAVVVTTNSNFSEVMYTTDSPETLASGKEVALTQGETTQFPAFAVGFVDAGTQYIHVISGRGVILEFYLRDLTILRTPAFRFEPQGEKFVAETGMISTPATKGARLAENQIRGEKENFTQTANRYAAQLRVSGHPSDILKNVVPLRKAYMMAAYALVDPKGSDDKIKTDTLAQIQNGFETTDLSNQSEAPYGLTQKICKRELSELAKLVDRRLMLYIHIPNLDEMAKEGKEYINSRAAQLQIVRDWYHGRGEDGTLGARLSTSISDIVSLALIGIGGFSAFVAIVFENLRAEKRSEEIRKARQKESSNGARLAADEMPYRPDPRTGIWGGHWESDPDDVFSKKLDGINEEHLEQIARELTQGRTQLLAVQKVLKDLDHLVNGAKDDHAQYFRSAFFSLRARALGPIEINLRRAQPISPKQIQILREELDRAVPFILEATSRVGPTLRRATLYHLGELKRGFWLEGEGARLATKATQKNLSVLDRVKKIVSEQLGVPAHKITRNSLLNEDLGADSLDDINLIQKLEDEFNIPDEVQSEPFLRARSVGELADLITTILSSQGARLAEEKPVKPTSEQTLKETRTHYLLLAKTHYKKLSLKNVVNDLYKFRRRYVKAVLDASGQKVASLFIAINDLKPSFAEIALSEAQAGIEIRALTNLANDERRIANRKAQRERRSVRGARLAEIKASPDQLPAKIDPYVQELQPGQTLIVVITVRGIRQQHDVAIRVGKKIDEYSPRLLGAAREFGIGANEMWKVKIQEGKRDEHLNYVEIRFLDKMEMAGTPRTNNNAARLAGVNNAEGLYENLSAEEVVALIAARNVDDVVIERLNVPSDKSFPQNFLEFASVSGETLFTLKIEDEKAFISAARLAKASSVNTELAQQLVNRVKQARENGLFGVLSVAMEMPVKDKSGNRLKRIGPGGGGQGVFMNEQPWAIAQKGVAAMVVTPLFSADIVGDPKIGTLEKYLEAYGGQHLMDLEIPVGSGSIPLKVFTVEQDGVPVIQIYDPSGNFFNTLYAEPNPDSVGGYIEGILLPLAAIEISRQLAIPFEKFQFNDWQTALGPIFMKENYASDSWPLRETPKSYQVIHNLEYQGMFPGYLAASDSLRSTLIERGVIGGQSGASIDVFRLTNLPYWLRDARENKGLQHYSTFEGGSIEGRHNFIKGGMIWADKILFVSKGHAREGMTKNRGYGLDGVLSSVSYKISPVYNRIKAESHRPENLKALAGPRFVKPSKPLAQMDGRALADWKQKNKLALQQELGLAQDANATVVGVVTRIVKQKGLNILSTVLSDGRTLLEAILDTRNDSGMNVQMAVLGTAGDTLGKEQEQFLKTFLEAHPKYQGRFVFKNKFDPVLAKQICAGSDLFFMPSIDEPGGISNQEAALLLDAVIATSRGGLQDFKEANGTPLELVDGFEANTGKEADQQRQISAQQILDRVADFLNVKQTDQYFEYLLQVARYNPDWIEGGGAEEYIQMYRTFSAARLADQETESRGVAGSPYGDFEFWVSRDIKNAQDKNNILTTVTVQVIPGHRESATFSTKSWQDIKKITDALMSLVLVGFPPRGLITYFKTGGLIEDVDASLARPSGARLAQDSKIVTKKVVASHPDGREAEITVYIEREKNGFEHPKPLETLVYFGQTRDHVYAPIHLLTPASVPTEEIARRVAATLKDKVHLAQMPMVNSKGTVEEWRFEISNLKQIASLLEHEQKLWLVYSDEAERAFSDLAKAPEDLTGIVRVLDILAIDEKEFEAIVAKRRETLGGYKQGIILFGEVTSGVFVKENEPRLIRDKTLQSRIDKGLNPQFEIVQGDKKIQALLEKLNEERREARKEFEAGRTLKGMDHLANFKEALLEIQATSGSRLSDSGKMERSSKALRVEARLKGATRRQAAQASKKQGTDDAATKEEMGSRLALSLGSLQKAIVPILLAGKLILFSISQVPSAQANEIQFSANEFNISNAAALRADLNTFASSETVHQANLQSVRSGLSAQGVVNLQAPSEILPMILPADLKSDPASIQHALRKIRTSRQPILLVTPSTALAEKIDREIEHLRLTQVHTLCFDRTDGQTLAHSLLKALRRKAGSNPYLNPSALKQMVIAFRNADNIGYEELPPNLKDGDLRWLVYGVEGSVSQLSLDDVVSAGLSLGSGNRFGTTAVNVGGRTVMARLVKAISEQIRSANVARAAERAA